MRATTASCISPKDRDLYPYNETIMCFTANGRCDDTNKPEVRPLLPITSIEAMTNRKEIFLQSIDFIGYDMSESVIESETDKQYANEQVFGHAVSSIWQPNYFRPSVRIGGEDVTSGISNAGNNPAFDLSIGLPMPYCLQINKLVQNPRDIEVIAVFAQQFKNKDGIVQYRNYPILAIINFWHNNR